MPNIYCTKKLRTYLNLNSDSQADIHSEKSVLSEWYGNIFEVEYDPYLYSRFPELYLLLLNSDSMLSFYIRIPDALTQEQFLSEFPVFFRQGFIDNGFTGKQIEYLERNFRDIHFAKASCKRMLGYLRSLAFEYTDTIRSKVPYDDADNYRSIDRSRYTINPNDSRQYKLEKQSPKETAKYLINQAMQRTS